jgi:hypothetical protein
LDNRFDWMLLQHSQTIHLQGTGGIIPKSPPNGGGEITPQNHLLTVKKDSEQFGAYRIGQGQAVQSNHIETNFAGALNCHR